MTNSFLSLDIFEITAYIMVQPLHSLDSATDKKDQKTIFDQ